MLDMSQSDLADANFRIAAPHAIVRGLWEDNRAGP
jgi:hypothetical protein